MWYRFHQLRIGMSGRYTPHWHPRTLQGHYGRINCLRRKHLIWSRSLQCSPVLVPQMTGGALPDGLVTWKVSVRHCPSVVTSRPFRLTPTRLSKRASPTVVVNVLGPLMTKLLKSSLNCLQRMFHLMSQCGGMKFSCFSQYLTNIIPAGTDSQITRSCGNCGWSGEERAVLVRRLTARGRD